MGYPLSCTLATGPQPARSSATNELWVIRVADLCKTRNEEENPDSDDDDDDDDSDDADETDPRLDIRRIVHHGVVNRIRAMPQKRNIVCTWSSDANINIYDVSQEIMQLENPTQWLEQNAAKPEAKESRGILKPRKREPCFRSKSDTHQSEGYAVDWSLMCEGRLATGDCDGKMFVWELQPDGKVSAAPLAGHKRSCEDIQWSPTQGDVAASCSVDGSIRVWDVRDPKPLKLLWVADVVDVNVIAWNRHASASHIVASGSDSGVLKVWDLRKQAAARSSPSAEAEPVASFNFHQGPICSLDWSPENESLLLVAGEDNQATFWDLSVEADEEDLAAAAGTGAEDMPPQLVFQHMGQKQLREARWHPVVRGLAMTTDLNGLQFLRPVIWKTMVA
eukprot:NODE_637_length_1281_cov_129.099026_g503_i0.p1 GENE.NODE_637_length_1281_cov_129.099026_g503_i0~~NODE_637_length_1281_cov_129.099026_g503_i0.p1  ORF type:complete len:399 (+),score=130.16 NODE_637_length_1281_cov_129.099026_g503_i0:24-1199(+)